MPRFLVAVAISITLAGCGSSSSLSSTPTTTTKTATTTAAQRAVSQSDVEKDIMAGSGWTSVACTSSGRYKNQPAFFCIARAPDGKQKFHVVILRDGTISQYAG